MIISLYTKWVGRERNKDHRWERVWDKVIVLPLQLVILTYIKAILILSKAMSQQYSTNRAGRIRLLDDLIIKKFNFKGMGNCSYKLDLHKNGQESGVMNKSQFRFCDLIGKGGFGHVWRIERKKFKTLYAMKQMSKARIVQRKSVVSIMNERKLLGDLKHPFLINMFFAF